MKIIHNPSSEWRNWWSEIEGGRKIQPANAWTIKGDCIVGSDGVVYFDNWRSAFSRSQHKKETLVSNRFWFCLWFAWQNQEGNYLGHVFPGENLNSTRQQMIDHGVEKILKHREDILRILADWRDDGLKAEELGILGGRVWKEWGGKGYLEAVQLLWALGWEVFWDEPKVIWLPTKWMNYGWPNGVINHGSDPQTVFVWEEWILIHTEGEILEEPISLKDIRERVAQILA